MRATDELQPLDVEAFVRELQDFLRRSANVIWNGAPPEELDFDASCPGANPDERANCIIRAKVMQMLTATEQKLREQVVAPLAAIDPAIADALEARLKATHDNFGHVLDQQPGFWQAVVHKRDVGQDFAQEIARLSADISAALFDKIKQLGQEVGKIQLRQSELLEDAGAQQQEIARLQKVKTKSESDIAALAAQITAAETRISEIEQKIADGKLKIAASNEQIATLTAAQAKIVAERQAISDRMKGVQSPFGALPIGLTEAVQVFPVIVAVGFIMALLTLASAMRLRSRYHVLLRKKYPAEAGNVDERVALTAPLFIDPFRRLDENAWRCAVLALPVIVYAAAILLIAESQRLAPQAEGTGRFIESGYGWLYFGVAVLLVLPLYHVAKAWSKYEPAPGRDQTKALRAPPLDNAHLSGQAGS